MLLHRNSNAITGMTDKLQKEDNLTYYHTLQYLGQGYHR